MASVSETGHAVNLENFKLIIDRVTGFGADYDPQTDKIKIAEMTTQWTGANTLHQAYIVSIEATRLPVNQREELYKTMVKLVKKSFDLYKSTNASKLTVKDAKGWADKITGNKVKIKKLKDGTPDPKSISNSQLSFTQRADHFKHLIELYKSDTHYNTTDTELSTAGLLSLLNEINTANTGISDLITISNLKRIARDESLYMEETGIIDVSLACKSYVRSLYGARSAQAKTVTGIYLKRFMRIAA